MTIYRDRPVPERAKLKRRRRHKLADDRIVPMVREKARLWRIIKQMRPLAVADVPRRSIEVSRIDVFRERGEIVINLGTEHGTVHLVASESLAKKLVRGLADIICGVSNP
jgi:hypothetical protein